jgi:tripartite-type tricarboxylate transporter receptor subunit TctC
VPTIRLLLPFPATGPRDIQGVERATRAYRAVSPHAPQPLDEVLADVAVIAGASDISVVRVRRPSVDNDIDPARLDAAPGAQQSIILVSHEALAPPGSSGAFRSGTMAGAQPRPQPPWIAPLAIMPLALLVSPKAAPAIGGLQMRRTLARPPRLGSAGERSASHFAGALLAQATGRDFLHVPYNGGYAALNALRSAEIDVMFAALPLAMPYVEAGKLPVLGLASKARFVLLPQVPTLAEAGLDLVWEGWFALYASRRMAPELRARLRERVQAAMASGPVRSGLLLRGLEPADPDLASFLARVGAERARAEAALAAFER